MSAKAPGLSRWQERALSLARAVWMCRASITVGLVMVPLLGKVPQGVDAVQGLSEDLGKKAWGFGLAMVGCAWTLWYCARLGTYMHQWPDSKASRWTARLSGLFPCVGVMWGASNAAGAGAWSGSLGWIMVIAACACGLVVALSAIRRRVASGIARAPILTRQARALSEVVRPAYRRTHGRNTNRLRPAAWWLMMGLLLMAVAVLGVLTAWPTRAVDMGTVTLVLIAGMCYAAVGTALVAVDRRLPVPVLVMLVCVATVLGWGGWTDNHTARTLPPLRVALAPVNERLGPDGPKRLPVLREKFREWLSDRHARWAAFCAANPDRAAGDIARTPVVLVCAEGGGIYAAYHAALVLAHIQDRAPQFAQHVFAISGVSGGSVGASLWVGSLQAERLKARGMAGATVQDAAWQMATSPPPPAPVLVRDLMTKVLGSDLLSRVLAFGLGADMVAALVPFGMDWADRAVQLEKALEEAAQEAFGVPVMEASFYDLWPGMTGLGADEASLPYLFLNTTCVETGGRVMVSPMSVVGSGSPEPRTLAAYTPNWNVRLSTAACLSARFPYVTPAGRFSATFSPEGCPGGEGRLGDGGYFDNSGAVTLDEILQEIEATRTPDNPFRLYVLRIGAKPTARARYARQTWPDLLSPPRTLLNTRGARGASAVETLRARANHVWERPSIEGPPATLYSEVLLDTDADEVPLGWVLSRRAQRAILAQVGVNPPCDTRVENPPTPAFLDEYAVWFGGQQPGVGR